MSAPWTRNTRIRNLICRLIAALLLLGGTGLLLYPTMADWWNRVHASRAISGYAREALETSPEDSSAALTAAKEYNKTLVTNPGRFLPSEEEHRLYETLLNPSGNSVMGYLEIPAIDVSLPIYHGTGDAVLQVGAGHMEGSSLPIGGLGTHAVLSGHRGLPSARLFTALDQLKEGDTFSVHVLDRVCSYRIDQILTVLPDDTEPLAIDPERDLCTLVTCTPYGINTHRLLVRGTRMEGTEQGAGEQPGASSENSLKTEADKFRLPLPPAWVLLPILFDLFLLMVLFHEPRGQTGPEPEGERVCKKTSGSDASASLHGH